MLKEKYHSVLELAGMLGVQGLDVQEQGNRLSIRGTAPYQLVKDTVWDGIKSVGGWENEVAGDIGVANAEIYGVYTVQAGDTLSKIARDFWGVPDYMPLFNANRDVLSNPDVLQAGQRLKIPNL